MKKTAVLIALFIASLSGTAHAQKAGTKATTETNAPASWAVDVSHSAVKFTVSHLMVSEVEGRFKMFGGTVNATSADFNNATIKFDADVNSINTDNDMRDNHLKGDDFFNAEKFPKMTFVSTSFRKGKGSAYTLEGNLTIRDVTKKVTFAVNYGGTMKDPYGNIKAGFKATGKISRKAYNLKWSAVTEAGGAVVGDEVSMTLNIELTKQK